MKKLIFTSLALFMMLSTWAYDFKVDSLYYNITSSTLNTVAVINNNGDGSSLYNGGYTGDIIIPSSVTYNGTTYSVTSIGSFIGTSTLKSLSIPASITSIAEYAFRDCDSLTTLTVDANNTYFSAQDGVLFNKAKTVLVHCLSAKQTYTIPSTVNIIETDAFGSQKGLTSITIPASVDSIKEEAFAGCSGLTTVLVPGSVKYIGYDAFAFCTGLKSVTFSNGLIMLDENAFYNCTSLTTINLPATLKTLGEDIFEDSGVTTITVDSSNPYYSAKDGVLFNKDTTTLVCFPNGRTGAYTAPSTVKTVKSHAFFGCEGITSVTLPSVTTIGDTVFTQSSLTAITMPAVTRIGICAFMSSDLTSVTIPSGIAFIDTDAFRGCRKMTSIYALKATALDITASNGVFYYVDSACVLHVPVGSYTSYSTANQWKDLIIKADIVSGINKVQATKLKVTCKNGNAVVTGLAEGTYVTVYNLQGTAVYSQKANAETVNIILPARGAYILNADEQSVKFIY
jgi:hypothetical protein